ncbi:hypothetical protein M404DRAFT_33141 [Pisolithus tinctorius Marx 270]|uniref:Uncharacterized protein n=1 Tax=Pisolithus tinctorius Marx 270 TaxID=870435 RepID=A0A0C3NMH4_PISTI|nr:hypothetical protein M404DRAFT_33141 [Pisolithus tinctorius Marx 270]
MASTPPQIPARNAGSNPPFPSQVISPPQNTISTSQRGKPKTRGSKSQATGSHKQMTTTLGGPPQESRETIFWERYPHLTSTLLSWLLQHPADRAVLFSSAKQQSAQEGSASLRKPHGRTKKEIHAVVAKVLFANDPEYCSGYEMQPEKFNTSVYARLATYVFI